MLIARSVMPTTVSIPRFLKLMALSAIADAVLVILLVTLSTARSHGCEIATDAGRAGEADAIRIMFDHYDHTSCDKMIPTYPLALACLLTATSRTTAA